MSTINVFGFKVHWPFPIASLLSSSATVLGYRIYEDECPKIIRKFVYPSLKYLRDVSWLFKHRFVKKHQGHIVYTGLEPEYWDEDTRILHACMACLCRYIEDMGGEATIQDFNLELRNKETQDANAPEGMQESQADRQAEALKIYQWWKYIKPAEEKAKTRLLAEIYGADVKHPDPWKITRYDELEKKIDQDEQDMLHRLIDIRFSLWT